MPDHNQEIEDFGKNDDFWLFGYGSLIWKPPPHYDQRVPGYIEGYVRRFWQASEDHRGTPSAPGRVVTLLDREHWSTLRDRDDAAHEPTDRVWGAAYHIPARHVEEVREYLDLREINGYSIQFTGFHVAEFGTVVRGVAEAEAEASTPRARGIQITTTISASPSIAPSRGTPITCLVYIGLPTNPQFLGPQDPDELARHILKSRGPSGDNKEYLYMLERGLLELSAESGDLHVSDLVRRCRDIEAREGVEGGDGEAESVGEPLHRVGSTEEQEEVEKCI